ncbi:helix-turn-helix transcriptional regulator [Streptomyces achromogenes]|uniref:helix-turn-helix transcriptional regulator n=1 Tax=Streptomyces achromogenes TaxID=67255 RepID=UPI00369AEEBE
MPGSFAEELRRLRGEWSLRDVARMAHCSKSTVGDLESGRRSPTVRLAQVLDTALGGDGTLVELAEADLEQKNARGKTPATPVQDVGEVFPPGWDDDDVLRRNLLKLSAVGAATAALAGLTPDDNPLDGTCHDLLVAHQDLRAVHGRIDNLRGAQAVYSAARDHHDQIRGWLARTSSETERHRLNALAADTGGFVGFLTYDLGQAELAITHYRDAAAHAQRAGDISSCCNLLGQTSRVLADLGHHDKALALADRALHLAGTQAHPAVRCWLHAVRAHHHACLTDSASAHSDLDAAWTLLGHTEDGEKPPYIGYLSEAELNKWTGHTAIRLADSRPASVRTGLRALDAARTNWPSRLVRGSAEVLTASARMYIAHGELGEAGRLVDKAIAIATTTGSARNLHAALDARTLLARRAGSSALA